MISSIISAISFAVLDVIGALGYAGVSVLMFLGAANIPIPSEVVMPFAGFAASEGSLSLFPVIVAGIIGGFSGSVFSFFLGRKLGSASLDIVSKISLHGRQDFLKTEKWFSKYGSLVVLVGLALPVVRSFISLPAGIFGIKPRMFALCSFISVSVWSTALALLGFFLGEEWEILGDYFHKFDFLIIGLIGILFVVWLVRHIKPFKFVKH